MAAIDFDDRQQRELTNSKLSHRLCLAGGWRQTYASEYYGAMIARSVRDLMPNGAVGRRVLEIGCGTGTQALVYAMLGARVIGVDANTVRVDIARKRCDFYRALLGRRLDAEFVYADVFVYTPPERLWFDAIYSMFALNLIQPTVTLVPRLHAWLTPGGRLVIDDGNYAHLKFCLRRSARALTPASMEKCLADHGLSVESLSYEGVVPPWLWLSPPVARRLSMQAIPEKLGRVMGRAYHLVASRA
jgi:SAM-dependent methyltransferase